MQKCREAEQAEGLRDLIADLPEGIIMAEVGVWRGEAMELFLASGKVKRYYAVDIWRAPVCEEAEREFDKRAKGKPVVKLKKTMREAVMDIDVLDFVYIDGSHAYKNVREDIIYSVAHLGKGKMIGGHDYSDRYKDTVVRAVDELLGKPDKIYKDSSWIVRL